MKGFSGFGNSPAKQKDEFGKIKKGEYPNLPEDISKVQKDKKGLYTTGREPKGSIHSIGPHYVSDTTMYPKGFSDWKGKLKEGDYIDETTHEAWGGVDVEGSPEGPQKATGKRKVYNKKTKKYEDYKSPAKQKTTKSDTVKTYPKSYTKEDIKFLEEQHEDVVRYEDLDAKGKAIWKKQGKPVPKKKGKK